MNISHIYNHYRDYYVAPPPSNIKYTEEGVTKHLPLNEEGAFYV